MGSYSVIVFLGKFEGILVKPCLEQSTITPSLAQWHLSGQVKSAAQTVDEFSPTRTEINTIITQDFILNNYSWSWWIFFHVISENMARMKKKSTLVISNFFFYLANQWISLVHFANETNKLRRDTARRNGAPWPPLSASLASQLPVLFLVVPLLLNYELSTNCSSHHQLHSGPIIWNQRIQEISLRNLGLKIAKLFQISDRLAHFNQSS